MPESLWGGRRHSIPEAEAPSDADTLEGGMKVGETYRFVPPMIATGFLGTGNDTKRHPDRTFDMGKCVEIGERVITFESVGDGSKYRFFALREEGGSRYRRV